jgi:uncharacterized membrane protein
MPGTEWLTRFAHLLASMVYLGGSWFLGAALIPGLAAATPEQRVRSVAAVIRWYHPTSLVALGVLVMTGAFTLTSAKAALGAEYFARLFTVLGPKLLLAFLLVMLSSYQFFGLGLRLVRSLPEDGGAVPPEVQAWQLQVVRRIQVCALLGVALAAALAGLGMALARP